MIPRALADVSAADLQELITAQRGESKTIDYKSALPGASEEEKRKFLYDVTALANTLGGDIVYGIQERVETGRNTGIPEQIIGVTVASREQEEQRLEAIVRSGVDPRIPGISMRWIDDPSPERPTLILRIPRSLLGPHMVTFGGLTRFYGRGTSGNFPMDVSEIRLAFDLSGDLGRRLQAFRAGRLIEIGANTVGAALKGRRRMVLHVVPISAFEPGAQVDLTSPPRLGLLIVDVDAQNYRYNVDGYVGWRDDLGYAQILRNGSVELVDTYFVGGAADKKALPSLSIEQAVLTRTEEYVRVLERLGATPPFFVALTLLGVQGVVWGTADDFRTGYIGGPASFDRDTIALPELLIDPLDDRSWGAKLRPVIDSLWQAAGRKGSDNYSATGEWRQGARGR